jgi:hypothetical protein
MSRLLKITFIINAILGILVGLPLLLVPGRFLGLFGWAPVEPLLDRLLGAAFLAFAWMSFRSLRLNNPQQALPIIEGELAFCFLGSLGFGRHLFQPVWYPPMVWVVFFALAGGALLWLVNLILIYRKK